MATRVFVWPDPERLVSLAVRAGDQGIKLTLIPRFQGLYVATSSDGATNYLVNETTCTCPASRYGSLCKHVCLVIYQDIDRLVQQYGPPPWRVEDGRVIAA